MTARAADTITLAEGHTIGQAAVDKKRRMLDGISIDAVLDRTRGWARASVYTKPPDAGYFGSTAIYDVYREAVARKDWPAVDQLVLDALVRRPSAYAKLLDAEEWMRAFSGRLCAEAKTARAAYRWMDPQELGSYLAGTFDSRVEDDLTRRGFKALSINPALNFLSRKIMMAVPLDNYMRGRVECVRYTSLPREVEARDERIADAKTDLYANEAEIRVRRNPRPVRDDLHGAAGCPG